MTTCNKMLNENGSKFRTFTFCKHFRNKNIENIWSETYMYFAQTGCNAGLSMKKLCSRSLNCCDCELGKDENEIIHDE